MSQPQRGGRGGRGRGARGASPSSRGRGSPVPSTTGTDRSGGGGYGPPRGGGPAAPGYGGPHQGGQRGGGFRGGGPGGGGRGRGGFRGGAPGGGPAEIFAAGQPTTLPPQLAEDELGALVRSFSGLRVRASPEMPLRPGWGTLGVPGVVRANFFAVNVPKDAVYYDYEIAISPENQAKRDRRARIMQLVERSAEFRPHVAYIAHDSAQRLVSARKLPQPLKISVRYLEEDGDEDPNPLMFDVEIKYLNKELHTKQLTEYMSGQPEHREKDVKPIISALNLIMQQYALRRGVRVSRTQQKYFFPSPGEAYRLSLGLEAHRGFFMSVRPMYKQLMVNINVCMSAFYSPGNLAQVMIDFSRQPGGLSRGWEFADRLKVFTKHLGYTRKYTIFKVMVGRTARSEKFDCAELGGRVSVEDFFKRKHRITLRYHDLPLINVSTTKDKPIHLPAEVCEIVPGQAYRGKLEGLQTKAMIDVACRPPAENANRIVGDGFERLGLRPSTAGATLGAFGITVSPQMVVAPTRRLPPPGIAYRSGPAQVGEHEAGWNMRNVKFQTGGDMKKRWAVLLVREGLREEFSGPGDPELETFLRAFLARCAASGLLNADAPPRIMEADASPNGDNIQRTRAIENIRATLRAQLRPTEKPSFVLVLLSSGNKNIYHGIKRLADMSMGIHTVHMVLSKAKLDPNRPNKQVQYFANVALKVNAKLGGVNHLLDERSMAWLRTKTTMVMGIDVTKPGPGSTPGTPSIAAVVASIDDRFAQFPASLSLQKPDWDKDSKEMVEDLTNMTIERLKLYMKKNKNQLPQRIIIYRDGVSEGEFRTVNRVELPRLIAAFKQISPQKPYKPLLTIVVCGKRHHSRFYPPDHPNASENGNTLPGTVLDKGITDIYDFDFYLQAHKGLKGQVRSTHYTVVYDENGFDANTLQQGTHTASYHYMRATRAVSLAPAAYYADIACERGRSYLDVLLRGAATSDDRSSATGARGPRTPEERKAERERVFDKAKELWGKGVHEDLKESMFYI